ncbi:hypothetical protein S245_067753, partial [Arachis hypogaea]
FAEIRNKDAQRFATCRATMHQATSVLTVQGFLACFPCPRRRNSKPRFEHVANTKPACCSSRDSRAMRHATCRFPSTTEVACCPLGRAVSMHATSYFGKAKNW